MLLDEPTSGLDPATARDVRDIIAGLRDEGRAVLVSTHNLDEAERLAGRVAVLRTRLVALDTPAALRARLFGRRLRVTVGGDAAGLAPQLEAAGATDVSAIGNVLTVGGGLDAPDVVRRLVEAGADIHAMGVEEPTLEDVYLRLMTEEAAS